MAVNVLLEPHDKRTVRSRRNTSKWTPKGPIWDPLWTSFLQPSKSTTSDHAIIYGVSTLQNIFFLVSFLRYPFVFEWPQIKHKPNICATPFNVLQHSGVSLPFGSIPCPFVALSNSNPFKAIQSPFPS